MTTLTSGYNRPTGYTSAFQRAVQGPSVLEAAVTNNRSLMAQISPQSFVLPNINMSAFKPDMNKAVTNRADIGQAAMAARAQVAQVGSRFTAEVQKAQNVMDAAMGQAGKNLGIDMKSAQSSFRPAPATTDTDAALSLAPDLIAPGLSRATQVAQGISEIKNEQGKLTPAQMARVADEMYTLLSPKRDITGAIAEPAAIQSDFDFESLGRAGFDKKIQNLYLPPEQHPEGKMITNQLHQLDEEVLPQYTIEGQERYETGTGGLDEITQSPEKVVEVADNNKAWRGSADYMRLYIASNLLEDVSGARVAERDTKFESTTELAVSLSRTANSTPILQPNVGAPAFAGNA